MSASLRTFTFSRLAGAVTALWLCGAGAAWAGGGGGGEDLGTLNTALQTLCSSLSTLGVNVPSCPQAPTITQGVLQLAAWNLVPTEMIRATNNIATGSRVDAGNPSSPPVQTPPPIIAFPVTSAALSNLLPNLRPLAFKQPNAAPTVTLSTNSATAAGSKPPTLNFASTKGLIAGQNYSIVDTKTPAAISTGTTLISFTGTTVTMSAAAVGTVKSGDKITLTPIATAAQLYDPDAGNFFYAVASGYLDHGGQPDTLFLFYEDLSRDNQNFNKGQIVASFSLPLTVLNSNGTENPPVMTNLQVKAVCNGGQPPCLQLQAVGGMTLTAAQLSQINFALVFAPSPFSPDPHAFFELAVPLVLTMATDPLYFINPIGNVGSPFKTDTTPPSIGIGPAAVPLCSTMGTCPPPTPPYVFPFCANLLGGNGKGNDNGNDNGNGNGNGQAPVPAIAAYYAISTAGETLLSAALPGSSSSVCPF